MSADNKVPEDGYPVDDAEHTEAPLAGNKTLEQRFDDLLRLLELQTEEDRKMAERDWEPIKADILEKWQNLPPMQQARIWIFQERYMFHHDIPNNLEEMLNAESEEFRESVRNIITQWLDLPEQMQGHFFVDQVKYSLTDENNGPGPKFRQALCDLRHQVGNEE